MKMDIADFLGCWWMSVSSILEPMGIVGRFERWPNDGGMNPTCGLSLQRGALEAELLVFVTGQAELGFLEANGATRHEHIEDIRHSPLIGEMLSRMVAVVRPESRGCRKDRRPDQSMRSC